MLKEISKYLRTELIYPKEDQIIFNNKFFNINKDNFSQINSNQEEKSIAFVDGGQAEIYYSGNICLSFIRVAAVIFKENKKDIIKEEFFLLTKAKYQNNEIFYESKIFGKKLIDEQDLFISSNDSSIRFGRERAPLSSVIPIARRLAELSLANDIDVDIIVLDGTLEEKYDSEKRYLAVMKENVCSISKTCTLFTTSGNNPTILLNKISPKNCWCYMIDERTNFVRLNEKSKHIFRFEGDKNNLPYLINQSKDAVFLGYPYGLILADKLARVSNQEKKSMVMKILLDNENKDLVDYLSAINAHDILDNLA